MRPIALCLLFTVGVCSPLICSGDVVILQVDIGVSDVEASPGFGATPNDLQAGFSEFSAPHQFNLTDLDQFNVGVAS